jgi:hypothetical protein
MMIEGSGSGSRAGSGSGSGSIPLTSGSGSGRPKIMWIQWIRIRNTAETRGGVPVFPELESYFSWKRNRLLVAATAMMFSCTQKKCFKSFLYKEFNLCFRYLLKTCLTSVADPGCLSRSLIFTHPGSRI